MKVVTNVEKKNPIFYICIFKILFSFVYVCIIKLNIYIYFVWIFLCKKLSSSSSCEGIFFFGGGSRSLIFDFWHLWKTNSSLVEGLLICPRLALHFRNDFLTSSEKILRLLITGLKIVKKKQKFQAKKSLKR